MRVCFDESDIEAIGEDWALAQKINASIEALANQRVGQLPITDDLKRSKIAWKFAVLRQFLTYRLVDLAESAIDQWVRNNFLASVVLARALLETAALTNFVWEKLERRLDEQKIDEIDHLVMKVTFGGKHPGFIFREELTAVNVLSMLDNLDKLAPGARDFYERLSEIAHPNSQGHSQFYAEIDFDQIMVTFSRLKRTKKEIGHLIVTSMTTLTWAGSRLVEIDRLIPAIADLQSPAPSI